MSHEFQPGEKVSWREKEKRISGRVLGIENGKIRVARETQGIRGKVQLKSAQQLTWIPPAKVSEEQLHRFYQYEVGIIHLQGGDPLSDLVFEKLFPPTPREILLALENRRLRKKSEFELDTEWLYPLFFEVGAAVGISEEMEKLQQYVKSDRFSGFPDEKSTLLDVLTMLFQRLRKEGPGSLDEVEQEIRSWVKGKALPPESRGMTLRQQDRFLRWAAEGGLAGAGPEIRNRYRTLIDQRCERDDPAALELKALGCYGNGNEVFPQDWEQSRDCLLRLMELQPNPYYALLLGNIFLWGVCNGGKPEGDKAIVYYSIGAAGGNAGCRFHLAEMYQSGIGAPKNPKLASSLFWELYDRQAERFQKGERTGAFPETALQIARLELSGADREEDPYGAMIYALQARTALKMRRAVRELYEDRRLAEEIDTLLEEAAFQAGLEKRSKKAELRGLRWILHTALEKRRHLEMTAEPDGEDFLLRFRIVPFEGETKTFPIFCTVPELRFCDFTEELLVRLVRPKLWEVPERPVCFDSMRGPALTLYGKTMARLDGTFLLELPGSLERQRILYRVQRLRGGKQLLCLSGEKLQIGERVRVKKNGKTFLAKVIRSSSWRLSELAQRREEFPEAESAVQENK